MFPVARALTEPTTPGGFMRSVMQHRGVDVLNDGNLQANKQERKITQQEQDAVDDEVRKAAMANLVNSWQERLQLISVIATFFASMEAAMLVNASPSTIDSKNNILKASNACLLGALILHVYAAVLSFLAAFLLIRYKLKEATRQELIAEGIKIVSSPLRAIAGRDIEFGPSRRWFQRQPPRSGAFLQVDQPVPNAATRIPQIITDLEPPIFSSNPHIEQVGPFRSNVSSHILSRTHGVCVSLASIGFVLAMVGILCYALALQPRSVSIFTTACLGGAVLSMGVLFV